MDADRGYAEDEYSRRRPSRYDDMPDFERGMQPPQQRGSGGPLPNRGGALPVATPTGTPSREPLFSPEEAARFRAAAEDSGATSAPPTMGMPTGDPQAGRTQVISRNTVYRARRPGAAALIAAGAILLGVLMVRALAVSTFGSHGFNTAGVLASGLALSAIPLTAMGLYGLVTGAAHQVEQLGLRVWGRPPLAYLAVGLVLFLAAGMAAA